jgi:lysozyme
MRRLVSAVALLLIAACVALTAYFYGLWIPNSPLARYPVKGIDVSHHNGEIDWPAAASDGVSFAYIKATEGADFQDDHFVSNCAGATKAGIICGAYHYFRLGTSGLAQAQNFIRTVPRDSLPLPPAVDLETWGNSSARPTVAEFQAQLSDFLSELRKAYGCEPVIYTSSDFINAYLGRGRIMPKVLWYRAVLVTPHFDDFDNWTFWQFTERARVKGVDGFVDMDVFRGPPGELLNLRSIAP